MWKKVERKRKREIEDWITRMIWKGKRGWVLCTRRQDGPKKRDGLSLDIGRKEKYMVNDTERTLDFLSQ